MDDARHLSPLRADISLVPRRNGGSFPAQLIDPLLEQRVKLDVTSFLVARALDRPQTVATLKARLAAAHGEVPSDEAIDKIVGFLDSLHALDAESLGRAAAPHLEARKQAVADPSEMPLIMRDWFAFSCTMCGSCCGNDNIGPVTSETIDGLSDDMTAAIRARGAPAGPYFIPLSVPGEEVFLNRTRNGYCIFLDDHALCHIHGLYGPEAKPATCNLFPITFIAAPEGIYVGMQMECRDYLAAKRRGEAQGRQALEEHVRWLISLAPGIPTVRPVIPIDGDVTIPYEAYRELEDRCLSVIEAHPPGSPWALVTKVAGLVEEFRRAHGGAPCTTVAPQEGLRGFFGRLSESLRALIAKERRLANDDDLIHVRTGEQFLDLMGRFYRYARRVHQLTLEGDAWEMFRDTYANYFHTKEITMAKSLVAGHAQLALRTLLACSLAFDRAVSAKRRQLRPGDVQDAVLLANFLFRNTNFRSLVSALGDEVVDLAHHHLAETLEALLVEDERSGRVEFFAL